MKQAMPSHTPAGNWPPQKWRAIATFENGNQWTSRWRGNREKAEATARRWYEGQHEQYWDMTDLRVESGWR